MPLSRLLHLTRAPRVIDYLSLDCEGCEADVMEYCRLHQDEHALIAEHYDALRESRTNARARTAAKRAATRERNRAK